MSWMPDDDDQPPQEYMSYNGMGRNPMLWVIPYMFGIGILCISVLPALLCGLAFGGAGWLVALIGVPLALFARNMCSTDDKALDVLKLEVFWAFKKMTSGSIKYSGGAFIIMPITYTRKRRNVECSLKAPVCR